MIGHQSGGGVRVIPQINNNEIYFTFQQYTISNNIDSLGTIEFTSLETKERTYKEFKIAT